MKNPTNECWRKTSQIMKRIMKNPQNESWRKTSEIMASSSVASLLMANTSCCCCNAAAPCNMMVNKNVLRDTFFIYSCLNMCHIFKTFNKVQKCASFCKSVQKCAKERGSHKMIGVRQKWDGRQTSLFSTLKLCNQPPASHICRNTNTNTNTKHKHHCSQS